MPKGWIIAGASLAALCVAAPAAKAAPWSNSTELRPAIQATSIVEKAAKRRCRWRNGEQHCTWRRSRPRVYGYHTYGRPPPEAFPTGSTAWWRAMDYEGRGGHGRTP